jgi:23S rRNA pseudouridine2605 synthase
VVTELGTRVDSTRQEIRVDGVPLTQVRRVYYAVHKPAGVVSTSRDPSGRPRVIDLIPSSKERLFAVGRLDMHSEGLILLTNDGDLANQLTHPRFGVRKVYRVLVAGHPTKEILGKLREGIHLAEGLARVAEVRIKRQLKQSALLEMVLEEGRNREIRRVLARVGHKVLHLTRIAVGPVRLGRLKPGEHRRLSREEIDQLRRLVRQHARKNSTDE